MRKLLTATAAAALLSAPAHAENFYGKLFGGVGFEQDQDFSGVIAGVDSGAGTLETDTGYVVGGAIGYSIIDNIAVEAEIAYRANEIEGGFVNGSAFTANDDLESLSFMGNVVYTAPSFAGFTPYIGGGAGAAGIRFSETGDRDYVFAYQGFAGVSYPVTEIVSAGVEYRYFGTDEADIAGTLGAVTTDYDAHNINLVLSARF